MKVQKLPPSAFSGENCDDTPTITLDGYGVYEWTPERDGKGEPEEVHLVMPAILGNVKINMTMRIQSRRALDELIGLLQRHGSAVWPLGGRAQ